MESHNNEEIQVFMISNEEAPQQEVEEVKNASSEEGLGGDLHEKDEFDDMECKEEVAMNEAPMFGGVMHCKDCQANLCLECYVHFHTMQDIYEHKEQMGRNVWKKEAEEAPVDAVAVVAPRNNQKKKPKKKGAHATGSSAAIAVMYRI